MHEHIIITSMLFIGIAGASSSGKTTLGKKIQDLLGKDNCFVISQDNFYKKVPDNVNPNDYNFDDPSAIDFVKMKTCIENMIKHNTAELPYYDFTKHAPSHNRTIHFSGNCIILEGIFSLLDEELIKQMNLKIYVDTDLDICLTRRLKRDVEKRGRTMDSVLTQYERFVKPAYHKFIVFEKQNSDIVIPNGGENVIALDIIKKFIFSFL